MEERTVQEYIEDMLANGRDWIAIIAVARAVRGGKWYSQCREILQAKGLMPKVEAEIHKQQKAGLKIAPDRYKKTKKQ